MSDKLTPAQRHVCMSHIHSKDTKPELKVRKWLWSHGYRYRLNVKGVPGKPDIVMRKYRTAIFVNGCFWHGHEGCDKFRMPRTNVEFWENKICRNKERDQGNYRLLHENGWQVIVVWECQLKPAEMEHTMRQLEVQLHDFYLKTFDRRTKKYVYVEEEMPIAAEEDVEYEV